MGLVFDSSTLIRAERNQQPVAQLLRQTLETFGDQKTVISSIALVELVHGIYRAKTPDLQAQRKSYIEEFLADVPVYPLTKRIAFIAGQIDAEQKSKGVTIPFQDLLIGATALQLGFMVVTLNTRHFQLIPNLEFDNFNSVLLSEIFDFNLNCRQVLAHINMKHSCYCIFIFCRHNALCLRNSFLPLF